jgi:hypothetical protein
MAAQARIRARGADCDLDAARLDDAGGKAGEGGELGGDAEGAARGTVRLALEAAGLETATVSPRQMLVVLKSVMPGELKKRGIEDADTVCQRRGETLAAAALSSAADDGADRAAAIFVRLGNG